MLWTEAVFSHECDPDVDGAIKAPQRAGYMTYPMPEKFRVFIDPDYRNDFFVEVRIACDDEDRMMELANEINRIIDPFGATSMEWCLIDSDQPPFADKQRELDDLQAERGRLH
jgi:hypothetical protein